MRNEGCLLVHEDDDVLVVNKPPGMSTHAPSPFAGRGLHEWLREREPRWLNLSILHRLDKETSGLMVFGKSRVANQALVRQFESRSLFKQYEFLTRGPVKKLEWHVRGGIVRCGERYRHLPSGTGGVDAETQFKRIGQREDGLWRVIAHPRTGRTHQIRVHAAASGAPVLGDVLYGGELWNRLCLHAAVLEFDHPATGDRVRFESPPEFEAQWRALRALAMEDTDSFRMIHGAPDGFPGWHLDRFGRHWLSQSESAELKASELDVIEASRREWDAVYHKILVKQSGQQQAGQGSTRLVLGDAAGKPVIARENGVNYRVRFDEGASVGIFLDQRENRRRLLTGYIGPGFEFSCQGRAVLNTFAYACAFSVCAALAGARTSSVDLSKKYLDWGRENFALNGMAAEGHEFLTGDAQDWLRRFRKKGRTFDLVLLDPPTFSRSKAGGVFKADRDYGPLVAGAVELLREGGVLFASTNMGGWPPEKFLEVVRQGVAGVGRKVLRELYVPQPPDFPISRAQPAYLKTVWVRIGQGD